MHGYADDHRTPNERTITSEIDTAGINVVVGRSARHDRAKEFGVATEVPFFPHTIRPDHNKFLCCRHLSESRVRFYMLLGASEAV